MATATEVAMEVAILHQSTNVCVCKFCNRLRYIRKRAAVIQIVKDVIQTLIELFIEHHDVHQEHITTITLDPENDRLAIAVVNVTFFNKKPFHYVAQGVIKFVLDVSNMHKYKDEMEAKLNNTVFKQFLNAKNY